MTVRAYDGARREVMGEIDLHIQVGPVTFVTTFQVMDMSPSYSCLLGRQWLHPAKALPSTLHQKIKFIMDDKLITISAEEEMLVSTPAFIPYIEGTEGVPDASFQSFETTNTTKVRAPMIKTEPSGVSAMIAKVMIGNGFQYGGGLGKKGQGRVDLIELPDNKDRRGLGYVPTPADKRRIAAERNEERLAKLEGREVKTRGIPICDIRQSFRSAGITYLSQIAVLAEEDPEDEHADLIFPCAPDSELSNWKIMELPVVFNSISK
jgi:hypothetical protein